MPSNALFVCRRSRSLLMADIAGQLKKDETIDKAFAAVIGDHRVSDNGPSAFDHVYREPDMYKPDLNSLSADRIAELTSRYDKDLFAWSAFYSERGLVRVEQDIYKPARNLSVQEAEGLIIKSLHYADLWLEKSNASFIFDISALGLFRLSLQAAARNYDVPYMFYAQAKLGERFTIYNDLYYRHNAITERYLELRKLDVRDPQKAAGHREKESVKRVSSIYSGHDAEENLKKRNNGNQSGLGKVTNSVLRPLTVSANLFREWLSKRKMEKKWQEEGMINYVDDRFRASEIWTRRQRFSRRKKNNLATINRKKIDSFPELASRPAVFYTWHLQPENSTSQLSPYHVNQDVSVQNISRVLPLNWIIIVKPHRGTIDKVRPREFQFLAELPNVFFADLDTPTPHLIKRCEAVVTLTGTVGMEALAMDKPVFYLGTASWRICKSARYAATYEELGHMLRNIDQHQPDPDDVASYFQAILDNSIELPNGYQMTRSPEKYRGTPNYNNNVALIARQVASEIDRSKVFHEGPKVKLD